MVTDNTKEIWEIIDDIVKIEAALEVYRFRLIQLGFREKDSDEIMNHFVVDKLKKLMEEN